MLRVVLVEDEVPNLELMKIIIGKNEHLNIVGAFTSSRDALKSIATLKPQVVFLDVEMPEMNGIELAKEIVKCDENIQVVFVTAYNQYAIDAFKVSAVNYILKPITEEALRETTERLLKNHSLLSNAPDINRGYKIFWLGSFNIYGGSKKISVKWTTNKVEELFAYFIYHKGNSIDKWRICDVLWPDKLPEKAEHNLHSTIYRLKNDLKALGLENVISYKQGAYRVELDNLYCDALEFERGINDNQIIKEYNISEYEKIIALYNGSLFEGKDYVWSLEWREKLNNYYIESVKKVAGYYIEHKQYNKAEEKLKHMLETNPLDENAHEMLMEIYCYMGNRIKLTTQYEQLNALLKEELNLSIRRSTKQLYKKLLLNLEAEK